MHDASDNYFFFITLHMLVWKTVCYSQRKLSLILLPALKLRAHLWEVQFKICGLFFAIVPFLETKLKYVYVLYVCEEAKLSKTPKSITNL